MLDAIPQRLEFRTVQYGLPRLDGLSLIGVLDVQLARELVQNGLDLGKVLLKNAEDLTDDQKKKLNQVFLLTPQLKVFYENKEKFRLIFNQCLTR